MLKFNIEVDFCPQVQLHESMNLLLPSTLKEAQVSW